MSDTNNMKEILAMSRISLAIASMMDLNDPSVKPNPNMLPAITTLKKELYRYMNNATHVKSVSNTKVESSIEGDSSVLTKVSGNDNIYKALSKYTLQTDLPLYINLYIETHTGPLNTIQLKSFSKNNIGFNYKNEVKTIDIKLIKYCEIYNPKYLINLCVTDLAKISLDYDEVYIIPKKEYSKSKFYKRSRIIGCDHSNDLLILRNNNVTLSIQLKNILAIYGRKTNE